MDNELTVEVADRSGNNPDLSKWGTVLDETLRGEEIESGIVSLVFIGEEEMTNLNSQYMDSNYATDVLSFPVDGTAEIPADTPRVLGDIVICPSVAEKQAVEHNWSTESELSLLVIHGALHLLGHDHQEAGERELMRGREAIHMKRYGLEHKVFDD